MAFGPSPIRFLLRPSEAPVLSAGPERQWNAIAEKAQLAVYPPRVCLALFAAAEALGLAFVHGLQPYLYIERIEPRILESLGFSASSVGADPNVYMRVPRNDESVFRALVLIAGVPVGDVKGTQSGQCRGRTIRIQFANRALTPRYLTECTVHFR